MITKPQKNEKTRERVLRELAGELFVHQVAVERGGDGVVGDFYHRPVETAFLTAGEKEADITCVGVVGRCLDHSSAMDVHSVVHDQIELEGNGHVSRVAALETHAKRADAVAKVRGLL